MHMDYRLILVMKYQLHYPASEIAARAKVSKSGVTRFLRAFRAADGISFPIPPDMTNDAIYRLVYPNGAGRKNGRDESYVLPDFGKIHEKMETDRNMTLLWLWNHPYQKRAALEDGKPYSYRQFCFLYMEWLAENNSTQRKEHKPGVSMEVDFAGKTFSIQDRITGEEMEVVVFVACLPFSCMIYAEGMTSTKEPFWIDVNNNALKFFGGVPRIIDPDNCKQAVDVNKDWVEPVLNRDYQEWADYNGTVILPSAVKEPTWKSHVEEAVKFLQNGIFHDLEAYTYFSLDQFNDRLWDLLDGVNEGDLQKRKHSRVFYWEQEKEYLQPLPDVMYEYAERKIVKVAPDYHVTFDYGHYSVPKKYLHKELVLRATRHQVRIYDQQGTLICTHPRLKEPGRYSTLEEHMKQNFTDYTWWSGPYFLEQASKIGPCTVEVIAAVLKSTEYEEQAYRRCKGILSYARRYSPLVLEECCHRALKKKRPTYTNIRETISSVNADMDIEAARASQKKDGTPNPDKGGIARSDDASSIDTLLAKTQELAGHTKNTDDQKNGTEDHTGSAAEDQKDSMEDGSSAGTDADQKEE